ncbi:MAG TPA: Nif3-like dinuclear metal center hexameric protein [Firmicutes bacterium]|nr:Nif3-like dinuclear metal center hexameric protein [Bacillota bacterium]
MKTQDLIHDFDTLFEPGRFPDVSQNGLQIQGRQETAKVLFAVDASLEAARRAAQGGYDLLVVHHGLFWSQPVYVRGYMKERLKTFLLNDVGLYAMHLPLDEHPELGNNVSLALEAGIRKEGPLVYYKGIPFGVKGSFDKPQPLEEIRRRLSSSYTGGYVIDGGKPVSTVGVITGDAGSLLEDILRSGIDLFISGEMTHAMVHPFTESGLSGLFYGHYATERGGILRLMEYVRRMYPGIECDFFEYETNL